MMARQGFRAGRFAIAIAIAALLVVAVTSCREQPPECAPEALAAFDALAAESASELAPRSVEAAKLEVEKAREHIDDQLARFKPFRSWSAERCGQGVAALEQARTDVSKARSTREAALRVERSALDKLTAGKQEVLALAAFLDGGVVGPEVAERIARARTTLDGAQGKLALALGELRGAGFVGPSTPVEQVAAEIDGGTRALATLSAEAASQAVARCRPRLGAQVPTFSGPPRVLQDWLMWRGEAGGKGALLIFRLDRERRACRQLAARADSADLSLTVDDDVRVWRPAGRVPTPVLAGFSRQGAWFVPQGGGIFAFAHQSAARFVRACHGKVSCEKPTVGATTVEADCACAYQDLDIAISDRNRRVRYVWDGRLVRAEL